MTTIGAKAYQDFPRWAVDAVTTIYNNRRGSWDTVDQNAVAKVLDQFPDASEEAKDNLHSYAMFVSR